MTSQKRMLVTAMLTMDKPMEPVVKELAAAGMSVDLVYETLATVTGHVDPDKFSQLMEVDGVIEVIEA